MRAFLPRLEDMLVDLLQFGDTGALRVEDGERAWTLFVQGGVLVGLERTPPWTGGDGEDGLTAFLAEALVVGSGLVEFQEGQGPQAVGLYDVRRALGAALGATRSTPVLLEMLQPVLEGWPELKADPDTLSPDPEVQAWLASLGGLEVGNTRLLYAPSRPGPALGALWVAWKLGDLDLHEAAIDDEELSGGIRPVRAAPAPRRLPTDPAPAVDEGEEAHDEETAHSHGTAPTWVSAGAPRSPAETTSALHRPAPRDTLHEGISRARAGRPDEALPLLQAAWDEDPERPELEEWLAYCRFAALRSSAPDQAREGLSALREIMYRTGPTGDMPLLPWILMARAQFERGDLLQARTILDAALQREPDDPEAMHLDGLLRQVEAKAEAVRTRRAPISLPRVIAMVAGVAVLAGLVSVLRITRTPAPSRPDLSAAVADLLGLRELHHLDGGWVGVAPAGWAGEADRGLARTTCDALAHRVGTPATETFTLLSDAGLVLAECGARLR